MDRIFVFRIYLMGDGMDYAANYYVAVLVPFFKFLDRNGKIFQKFFIPGERV